MKFAVKLSILLLAIVVFFSVSVSVLIYLRNIKILEKEVEDKWQGILYHIMDKIDRVLYERYTDIQFLATDTVISSRDSTPKEITERLIDFRNNYKEYLSLSFFDLNRVRIADTSRLHINRQYEDTLFWQDIMRGKVSVASDIHEGAATGIISIYFASPVKDKSGEVFGVVVSRMVVTKLQDIIGRFLNVKEKEVVKIDLVNKDGLLLYSNYNRQGILNDEFSYWESMERIGQGELVGAGRHNHKLEYPKFEEKNYIYIFVREQGYLDFKGNDWVLIVHVPLRIAFAPAIQLRNELISISLFLLPAVILVALLFSYTISRPIVKLKAAAVAVGKGDLEVKIEVKTKDELRQCAEAFNQMVQELKKARSELLREKRYIEVVIASMSDILVVVDSEDRITRVNKAFLRLLGYEEEEVIGRPIDFIFSEKESFLKGERIRELIQKNLTRSFEAAVITKTGEKILMNFSAAVMYSKSLDEVLSAEEVKRVVGIVAIGRDMRQIRAFIAELEKSKEKLENWSKSLEEEVSQRTKALNRSKDAMYNIMGDLQKANDALIVSRRSFYDIVEKSSDGLIIVDKEGVICFVNPAAEEIFGREKEELIGRFMGVPELSEELIEAGILNKAGKKGIGEMRIINIEWNSQTAFLMSIHDITQSRKAEESIKASLREKEVLLQEIHHRVKNNLQIISSLLQLQSRCILEKDTVKMFQDSENRVRTMALIHETLYHSSDLARINFARYIERLVTYLFYSYGAGFDRVKMILDAKEVSLDINTAVPCGLIINELVSNSLKYAFPENKKGEVRVGLYYKKDNFVLIVRDNGIGISKDIDYLNTKTLGFQLVNGLVKQIGGVIEFSCDKGTEFRIVFKG